MFLYKRLEADTTELRVGVGAVSPTYNTQLKAQRASDLCLCTSTHAPPLVQIYPPICISRSVLSIKYQGKLNEIWMNSSLTGWKIWWWQWQRGSDNTTTRQSFDFDSITHYSSGVVQYGPASRNNPDFLKTCRKPQPVGEQLIIAGCPTWLDWAAHWLSIWSNGDCVAVSPSGKKEIT